MKTNWTAKLLMFISLAIFISPGYSGITKTGRWVFKARSDFAKFNINGLEIESNGSIKPGVSTKAFPVSAEKIWSILEDGDNVYLGTGSDAKILRIKKTNLERDESEPTVVWEGDGLIIYALYKTDNGDIFAGISPQGKLLRFRTNGDDIEKINEYQLPDSYIWKIVSVNSGIWISTGSGIPGKGGGIYRLNNDILQKIYSSADGHVLSMVKIGERVYAGTQGKSGHLIQFSRIDKDIPHAKIIFDPQRDEIIDLAADNNGYLYAVTVSNSRTSNNSMQVPSEVDEELSEESGGDEEEAAASPPAQAAEPQSKATIYRIDSKGKSEVWLTSRTAIGNLILTERGLLASAADLGAIYRIDGQSKSTLILNLEEKNILAISENFIGTGDPAVLHKMIDSGEEAYCRSNVLTAEGPSAWGVISFEAKGDWELRTRSGNTASPDATWSAWSLPIRNSGGRIESPSGQYLQYSISYNGTTKEDLIRDISITYQVFNRPPRISEINVSQITFLQREIQQLARGGTLGQIIGQFAQAVKNLTAQQHSQKKDNNALSDLMQFFAGTYSISWRAEDPDHDKISQKLELIDEATGEFIPLISNYTGNMFVLNSSFYPEGSYRIKITADDRINNDNESYMSAEIISEKFTIDNTPPEIKVSFEKDSESVIISGTANDLLSRIASLYMMNSEGEWESLKSEDGICDQMEEAFRIIRTGSKSGFVIIKASDSSGNVGYAKLKY